MNPNSELPQENLTSEELRILARVHVDASESLFKGILIFKDNPEVYNLLLYALNAIKPLQQIVSRELDRLILEEDDAQ